MAPITRIEVANFLCDGYVEGQEWVPMYRGETFRLFGQSAAMQIDNGGGKTSLAEACLYLLTRDRRLKNAVEKRMAPSSCSNTHVRIEFVDRPLDESVVQLSLITELPEDIPGKTYVIGFIWNRSKEPIFYKYRGSLEDAPCYARGTNSLRLFDNDTFKKSVESIPNSEWNISRVTDWLEEIKQFTSIEVLKQNVEFQLDGAGDYSAMFNRVKTRKGETYDAAFFRLFVAPEMLKQPMGAEGEIDEDRFEDSLFKTMKKAVDAMVNISMRQKELDEVEDALVQFEPVETRADKIFEAYNAYERELENIIKDAGVVYSLVEKNSVPGIPDIVALQRRAQDASFFEVLPYFVIDRDEGILLTDEGLAKLINIDTRELNRRATKKYFVTQPIDFTQHIKNKFCAETINDPGDSSSQPFEIIEHIKNQEQRGGRRKPINGYHLNIALELIEAFKSWRDSTTDGVAEQIIRAFPIMQEEIDTNPYRRECSELLASLADTKVAQEKASNQFEEWSGIYESLMKESRQADADKVAYETFVSKVSAGKFLSVHKNVPLIAKGWAEAERAKAEKHLGNHNEKVGQLTTGYASWQQLTERHGLLPLSEILQKDCEKHSQLKSAKEASKISFNESSQQQIAIVKNELEQKSNRDLLSEKHDSLKELADQHTKFRKLFGDVDLLACDPDAEMRDAQKKHNDASQRLNHCVWERDQLQELSKKVATFIETFGNVDPDSLNPIDDLNRLNAEIFECNQIIKEHEKLVWALQQFEDANHDVFPDEWLEKIESERNTISEIQRINIERIKDIWIELQDLKLYAMADSQFFTKALTELDRHQIPYSRLHSFVMERAGENKQELLTLFSSMLSAPVVNSINDAERATEILETARLTVPVFLADKLADFVGSALVETAKEKLVYTFLVGRRTRQVEILLNPDLVLEESSRLESEKTTIEDENVKIDLRLEAINPKGEASLRATDASLAIKNNSVDKHNAAVYRIKELSTKLPVFEERAKAVDSISAMKSFIEKGGQDTLNRLVLKSIPQLEEEKENIQQEINRLKEITTNEVRAILSDARKFMNRGGGKELNNIQAQILVIDALLDKLRKELDEIKNILASTKTMHDAAANAFAEFENYFSQNKIKLERAIAFADDGSLDFMLSKDVIKDKLEQIKNDSIERFAGIDFDSASRYVNISTSDERGISDRLAEAETRRNQAKEQQEKLWGDIGGIEERINLIRPFIRDIHELVFGILGKYSSLQNLSDDIVQKIKNFALHSCWNDAIQQISIACIGNQPSTSDTIKIVIRDLAELLSTLKINMDDVNARKQELNKARKEFASRRDEFCDRYDNGDIRGLQKPEVEKIREAKTIDQLREVRHIKELINASKESYHKKLKEVRATMDANKTETIEQMAHFARQAKTNLEILDDVMKRKSGSRFFVEAEVAEKPRIQELIESLINEIEDRERSAKERGIVALDDEIASRNKSYKERIHEVIYGNIFISPRIFFSHKAIRNGDKTPLTEDRLSAGQRTALMMMWLIRHAEYSLVRVMRMYSSKKDQKTAMKTQQRIMFFDGLFSNLSNQDYIDNAFQGLKDVASNFQLIGLIHSPYYVNNKELFPVHLVGKKKLAKRGGLQQVFVAVEPAQEFNEMILYTSAYRENQTSAGHTCLI